MATFRARRGVLMIDGWGGRSYQPVIVEDETPKRYRVRAVNEQLRLPLRGNGVRIVLRSGTVLVPKHAVRLDGDAPGVSVPQPEIQAIWNDIRQRILAGLNAALPPGLEARLGPMPNEVTTRPRRKRSPRRPRR